MRRTPNPFKPSFGVDPPLLVGRNETLEEFEDGLDSGPGSAARASLYTGARGSGKTVLLNAVEDLARQRGWVTVSETANRGFVKRLTQTLLPAVLNDLGLNEVRHHLKQVSLPVIGGSVEWESVEPHLVRMDLRTQIKLLTDILAEREAGLLITLDEIHAGQIADLREFAVVLQHAFREDREVAFAAAGLQASVSDLLQDDVLTFLRRADQHHLGAVSLDEVGRALREPIETAGKTVKADALGVMAQGTQGYPFLIQLVGARCWRQSNTRPEITMADAQAGVVESRRRLGSTVHAPALKNVPAVAKSFLVAMAQDDGPSLTKDIAERLGESPQYIGVYRSRLIGLELIQSAGHGAVEFTLPYLRDYIREHVVSEIAPTA